MAKNQSVGTDRQAKIQAAAKSSGTGANKIVIAAVVAIIAIIAVVGVVIFQQVSAQKAITGNGQAIPAGASIAEGYNPFPAVTAKTGAPTVDVFEDFQCPACGQFEAAVGESITTAAKAGDITVKYHVLHFLDQRLGNDGSVRAANGAFCAADVDKFAEFHKLAYDEQPQEGAGWSTDGLKALASKAGISGAELDTWTKCVDLGKYTYFTNKVNDLAFAEQGIKGTPTVKINGEIAETATIATPDTFKAAVEKATKK